MIDGGRMPVSLENLRQQIHEIDEKLVYLLCKRLQLVHKIGKVKVKHGLPIIDESREEEVFNKVLTHPHDPIDSDVLKEIFQLIIHVSREEQRKLFINKEKHK